MPVVDRLQATQSTSVYRAMLHWQRSMYALYKPGSGVTVLCCTRNSPCALYIKYMLKQNGGVGAEPPPCSCSYFDRVGQWKEHMYAGEMRPRSNAGQIFTPAPAPLVVKIFSNFSCNETKLSKREILKKFSFRLPGTAYLIRGRARTDMF